jgi:transposase
LADAKESLLQHICIIKLLRAQLLDITRKIREMSRTDAYATNMKLLCSIPGIGFHTSISFLIEIEDINRFGNEREFASFIGIVPTCHSSGEKENVGEMTFRGNKHMQQKLIEASWVAISKDRALAACYMKYRTRMDKNKAIIRIARKLSNRIMTILKKQEKYVNDKNVQ